MAFLCNKNLKATFASPIGELEISGCDLGMHYIKRIDKGEPVKPDLKTEFKLIESKTESFPESMQECIEWFTEYFALEQTGDGKSSVLLGKIPSFCPKIGITEFYWQVYTTLASEVKFGSQVSYSRLAELVKNPNASRAVGAAMKNNPFIIVVPCHRVVKKSGEIGNYSGGGQHLKEWLLKYEGRF